MCVYSSTAVAVADDAADVLFFFVFFFCIVVFSVPGRIYCFCFSADVCTLFFFFFLSYIPCSYLVSIFPSTLCIRIECNRTYYGNLGITYSMELHRPKEDRIPYVCDLTFTAAGGMHGDIIQVRNKQKKHPQFDCKSCSFSLDIFFFTFLQYFGPCSFLCNIKKIKMKI